ncbi:MAG: tRNA (adenosine(37)-N6)-threonylcarbamoyltransferase complex dimerization subunit type 1 TsaB [Flavobacterium sp.]
MSAIYILQIESSTKNCSVALSKEGETIAYKEIAESGYTHAENLHVFIDEVLSKSDITFDQLAAVAVSQGPGSYTGLRIGVSAAKGLCFALDIPLIAVDTLEILSKKIVVEDGFVVPLLDARRMEVYAAIFSSHGEAVLPVHSKIINEKAFSEYNEKLHLLGDGALKCQGLLQKDNIVFYPDILYPSAQEMSLLAYEKFKNKSFENVAYFEPFYLKEFYTGS